MFKAMLPLLGLFAASVYGATTINLYGYLGNDCMGEEQWGVTVSSGECASVAEYDEAYSIVVPSFPSGTVYYYYNDDCTDQVGDTVYEETCYQVTSDIKSVKWQS